MGQATSGLTTLLEFGALSFCFFFLDLGVQFGKVLVDYLGDTLDEVAEARFGNVEWRGGD